MAKGKKNKTGDYILAGGILLFLFLGLGAPKGEPAPPETDDNSDQSGVPIGVVLSLRLSGPRYFWHVESVRGESVRERIETTFDDVEVSNNGPRHVLFGKTVPGDRALTELIAEIPSIFDLFDVRQFDVEIGADYQSHDPSDVMAIIRNGLYLRLAQAGVTPNLVSDW